MNNQPQTSNGVKSVVTGGAGFIGAHIVDALVERGDEVHVVDTFVAGKRDDRINARAIYHEVDIRDYDALLPIVDGAAFVFHEAALPRVQFSIDFPRESFDVNVEGTVSILNAAHKSGVRRVVNASTGGAVYGEQPVLPFEESMLPKPESPYALQKYMTEQMCALWSKVYGLKTVSLRYFNVYGSRMDPDGAYALAIPRFCMLRKEGKSITIRGDGSHTRDYVHVRDIVAANLSASESPTVGNGEALNVGTGREVSVADLARLIGGPIEYVPDVHEPARAFGTSLLAERLLGWKPTVALEDGIVEIKKEWGIV